MMTKAVVTGHYELNGFSTGQKRICSDVQSYEICPGARRNGEMVRDTSSALDWKQTGWEVPLHQHTMPCTKLGP